MPRSGYTSSREAAAAYFNVKRAGPIVPPLCETTATALVPTPTLKLPLASSLSATGLSLTSCFSLPTAG